MPTSSRTSYWFLLLIPLTFFALDSYGWMPQSSTPLKQHSFLPHRLLSQQPHTLTWPSQNQATKARLTHHTGDIRPLSLSQDAGQTNIQIPQLPSGHYLLDLFQGEQHILQHPLHLIPQPTAFLDRYQVQGGSALALWVNKPESTSKEALFERPFTLTHLTKKTLFKGFFSAQNPAKTTLPKTLIAGKYRLKAQGLPPFNISVGATSDALKVILLHNELQKGQQQSLHLYMLTPAGKAVSGGWIRINDTNYPVIKGHATVDLQANQLKETLAFTAGDARGNITQGKLHLKLSQQPWLVHLAPQGLTWSGKNTRPLLWHATQNAAEAKGIIATGSHEELRKLQRNLSRQFISGVPIQLSFKTDQGQAQQLAFLPSEPQVSLDATPNNPHALSTLYISDQPDHNRALMHYIPQDSFSSSPLSTQNNWAFDRQQNNTFSFVFLWAIAGIFLSGVPMFWIYFHATNKKRNATSLTFAGIAGLAGIVGCAAFWSKSPALMWQSYAMGTVALGASMITGLRHKNAPHPVLGIIQVILLFLCAWFALTYAPVFMPSLLLWLSVLSLVFVIHGQHKAFLLQGCSLALLAVTAFHNFLLYLQPTPHLATIAKTHPVVTQPLVQNLQLKSQTALPARLPLKGQGGTHILKTLNKTNQWATESLKVRYTPQITARPLITATRGDQLKLAVKVKNPTQEQASIALRFNSASQQLDLMPGETRTTHFTQRYTKLGKNTDTLQQGYQGKWYPQTLNTYVIPRTPAKINKQLRMDIIYPQTQCKVGDQIPVMVEFHHRLRKDGPVGVQLGIPAGFEAIASDLSTRKAPWLQSFRQSQSHLNLITGILRAGQRARFRFRLKATHAGTFYPPSAQIFDLGHPTQKTVLSGPELKVNLF